MREIKMIKDMFLAIRRAIKLNKRTINEKTKRSNK